MELALKFADITGYEAAGDLIVTHEESMETAIPEYCPDLARIVDTVGQVNIREKNLSDGRLNIGGTIRVTVLYTSEESAGLRSLTLSVPFSCGVEDKRQCESVCVDSRLLLLEVKPLGTRKLYVRVLPEFRVRGYRKWTQCICTGASDSAGLQLRCESVTLPLMSRVWEREFPFAQEIPPESGESAPEDLLMDRTFLRVTACQHFGSKLVVKGEAVLSILYRAEGQRLCSREVTLPFSQIMEGEELPEETELSCTARILDREVHQVRTENGNGFGVTMRIGVVICAFEQREVEYVSDLYSTRCSLDAVRQPVTFVTAQLPDETRCNVSQHLEDAGSFVYLTAAEAAVPEVATEGGSSTARTSVRLRVLYIDESGAPVTAERTCEISAQLRQTPSAAQIAVEPETWQRAGGAYDLHLPVTFCLRHAGEESVTAVSSVNEQGEVDRAAMPSLILRRLRDGETLWDVAKQCRTQQQAIIAANELEQGADLNDIMLLIPKMR
ncbi:MAG: DUF3794 domain-containing protein [Oscillospiraceae bacterium]|nr:DUF3794 domain-containing protein [Oscillospiraceae bacterium]